MLFLADVRGIGLNAAATLLYLLYTRETAPLIHVATGFGMILFELSLMHLAVHSTPPGCEALGFLLMMSVRNFGVGMSDVLATKRSCSFYPCFRPPSCPAAMGTHRLNRPLDRRN